MKLTVVLRHDGTLVGTAQHLDERSEVQAMVRPMAGHTVHEIEVPDDYQDIAPAELHERIRAQHLRGHCK